MKRFWALVLCLAIAPALLWAQTPSEQVLVTGASHIDLAWKWPYTEGEGTCHFTFQAVLDMMDDYDDHPGGNPVYYAQSNALAYAWMERDFPAVFARMKQRIEEGRWEIVGGMWVESDAELPSGESFCRQFLYGQWYFYDRFGKMAEIGWLPDSFGYNANLPQFMHKSGIDRYFFYKLNWNDTNPPDYNLFWWEAPDGSRVLAHLAYGQYNNQGTVFKVHQVLDTMRAHEPAQDTAFFPLGIGNHGGGIVRFFLTRMLAMRDAGYNILFGTADDYFDGLDAATIEKVIADELYFEKHRGTYTSRDQHKRQMRAGEYLLQNAETFSALAALTGYVYPADELATAWKMLLRDQFHDTMAGTCLEYVYAVEVAENFKALETIGQNALDGALTHLAAKIDTGAALGEPVIVFNPNGFAASEAVSVEAPDNRIVYDAFGETVAQQRTADGRLIFRATDVPGWGWRTYYLSAGEASYESEYAATVTQLENDRLLVELDAQGQVTGVYDKQAEREFIQAGRPANALTLYRDPHQKFDSWDIGFDKYHDEPTIVDDLQSIAVTENGPVRQVIELTRNGAAETYVQRIILYTQADWVDFETEVLGWGEPAHRFLKVAFPLAVANERKQVRHNIPYGSLTRTLDGHRADWEFIGHKWVDLSETSTDATQFGAGAALLAREKYGYDVANDGPGAGLSDGAANVLRLSLLKSGTSPSARLIDSYGPVTDRGDFVMHYRLATHAAAWGTAELYRRGETFANPLQTRAVDDHAGDFPSTYAPLTLSSTGGTAIPTTLKAPERDAADNEFVLRVVEIDGAAAQTALSASDRSITSFTRTDLLERPQDEEDASSFAVGHNAVETFRVVLGENEDDDDDDNDDADDDDLADDDDDNDNDGCGC